MSKNLLALVTISGTLLNSVLVDVMTALTSLEDISADEATQLHAIMTTFTARCPQWFIAADAASVDASQSAASVTIQQFTRKWNKFTEMMFVLNASLQGIADRWADGKGPLAAECGATEVKQLIRALFQNTDRRAAVLARIK